MGYSANRKKELETTSTLSYTQKRKQELEKESLASSKGMTAEQFDRSKFADAENTRKAQMQKELNSVPEPTNLESFNKKASETKWYEPKIGLVKDFLKLDTSDKQKVAQKATEDMTKSDVYAFSDAFADSATLGIRPVLQKKIFENVPNGEDYFQKKKDTKENNKVANTLGTIAGYIAPGAAVEKVAAKALAPTLTKVGSKIGQKAIFGAVTGGGMELAEGLIRGDSPEDLANRTATGAAFGGIGDAAVYGISKGAETVLSKLKAGKALTQAEHVLITEEVKKTPEILSLPEVKQYLQITGPTLKDRYVITPDVIEALPPKPTIDDIKALKIKSSKNVGSTGFEMYTLDDLEDMIKIVESDKKRMIDDQLKWLKSTHGKGVEHGSLFVDDLGNVVGRQGRISKNELWYQKWAKENNYRKINNNDLREIAEKQLKEGYESLSGDIPADGIFKRYDDALKLLLQEKNSNNRFNNSLNKASQYLEAKRNQFYNVPEQYRKEIPKLVPRTTVTPPKFESKYAKESLNLLEPPQIKTLKNNNVSVLPTPSNIVAEKTPTSVTTSYKPETSLKTDLTKPSEVIPDGEIKERGFPENIRTDANRPDAERAIFDKDPEYYNVLNNKTTLGKAQKRFAQGYENALKDFDATKGTLRADNVPLAKLIADEAVKRGDVATARRVLVDVAESLTTAGQYSQAAKILRESNDPSAIIDYLNREVNKLNTQGAKRYGKKWENIDLTPEELEKLNKMPTDMTDEQKTKLFEEIGDSITSRIPTTAREKFDAVRRMAMLFNPKTHIRNVVGNSIMAGLSKISDAVATTLEKGLKPELRTKSFIAKKEFKDIAETYWQTNKKNLTEGGRWELFGVKSPFGEKATFKTKWLETLNDVSKKTLEGEDVMFMKKHFTDGLAGFMQARNLKEPTEEAVEYATKRAQEATLREANELANAINKLKGTKGGLIVEAAIPFTKTPANILTTGVRYSPIGLINSAVQLISKENPAKVIETFSKGLTGSGLTMMGFYMAKNGLARGQYENSSKVEGLKQASGELPNSIITPKGSYTIDWAQPASLPFFMGVGMAESIKKNGGDDYLEVAKDALIAGGDSLINQSMLKNIKDLFGGYGSTTEKVMQLPINYLTQAFPTVAGQATRIIDPLKRQTDYSSSMSKTLTGLQAKTPIASKELPLKRDILGQPQKYGEGVLNIVQQLISPGYIAKKSDDPIIKEINRLYESEGSDFLPRATVYKFTKDKTDYKLTNEEISEFQRIMGEYTKSELTAIINSPEYNSMSDADKAKRIKAINDDGYELAKQSVIKTREP